jgi:hypothetical protein
MYVYVVEIFCDGGLIRQTQVRRQRVRLLPSVFLASVVVVLGVPQEPLQPARPDSRWYAHFRVWGFFPPGSDPAALRYRMTSAAAFHVALEQVSARMQLAERGSLDDDGAMPWDVRLGVLSVSLCESMHDPSVPFLRIAPDADSTAPLLAGTLAGMDASVKSELAVVYRPAAALHGDRPRAEPGVIAAAAAATGDMPAAPAEGRAHMDADIVRREDGRVDTLFAVPVEGDENGQETLAVARASAVRPFAHSLS